MVRRKYTTEFKIEAVRLAEADDVSVEEVTRELGIHDALGKSRATGRSMI